MMMNDTQFDEDIALTHLSKGRYQVDISDAWNVTLGPNGGYIAAIILNGMKMAAGEIQTRSITFHFLSASVPGPAELEINVEKKGRLLTTCTARLIQGERTIALAIATFAPARESFEFCDLPMPVTTRPKEVDTEHRMKPGLSGHVPFRDNYDQRLTIGPLPPAKTQKGRVGGWTRMKEHRQFDDLAVVAISDSWFPGLHAMATPEPVHAPTIDHTVHFLTSLPLASIAIDGFLLVEFETEVAAEGYLIENGKIWSESGLLIAKSRQLAIILPKD